MRAKIVIVGGGVNGITIAMHAALKTDALREPVMLLERGTLGAGSSGRSAAVVSQLFDSPCLVGMARDSLRSLADLEGKTGRSVGFLGTGLLTLARSRETADVRELVERVETAASMGIEVQGVTAEKIRRLFPGIQVPDDAAGAWEPGAGCLDPGRALESLAALARERGAVIRGGTGVEEVEVSGGRVVAVRTPHGRVECEQLVVAAGPWSKRLIAELGVDLPLRAVQVNHFLIQRPEGAHDEVFGDSAYGLAGPEDSSATSWFPHGALAAAGREAELDDLHGESSPTPPAAHPVLIDEELGFYARCEPLHDRSQVGRLGHADAPEAGDPDEAHQESGSHFNEWAREVLEARLPYYEGRPELGTENAMLTVSPDDRALIGPVPGIEGLFVACGFSGHGLQLAPSIGEGVAQMLLGEPISAFEPEFFSPERFF